MQQMQMKLLLCLVSCDYRLSDARPSASAEVFESHERVHAVAATATTRHLFTLQAGSLCDSNAGPDVAAPEGNWDATPAAGGFEAAPAPVVADAGDWGAAPAPGGFEAAPAPAPAPEYSYQAPDQFAAGY